MLRILLVAIGVAAIAACTSDPKRCAYDSPEGGPNTPWAAVGCDLGGGFNAALERQRLELNRLQSEMETTELQARLLEREAAALDGQIRRYHEELDAISSDLETLHDKLSRATPSAKEKRALREVLLEEIQYLRAVLKEEKAKDQAIKAEIIKFRKEVDRRQIALEALTIDVLQE